MSDLFSDLLGGDSEPESVSYTNQELKKAFEESQEEPETFEKGDILEVKENASYRIKRYVFQEYITGSTLQPLTEGGPELNENCFCVTRGKNGGFVAYSLADILLTKVGSIYDDAKK